MKLVSFVIALTVAALASPVVGARRLEETDHAEDEDDHAAMYIGVGAIVLFLGGLLATSMLRAGKDATAVPVGTRAVVEFTPGTWT